MSGVSVKFSHSYLSQRVQILFREPYRDCTAKEILRYFRERDSITYFPVIDLIETERSKIEKIVHDEFELNGETQCLPHPIRWTHNPSQDREWLILLHKFYYAVGLGRAFADTRDRRYLEKWVALTDSWMNLVPLNFFPSDVAGRRIQNWIFAHYFFVTQERSEDLDPDFYVKFLSSLSQQVSYLCNHLTPARNHRTLELCAIFLAGVVFPELREAEHWLNLAKTELTKNVQTDLLPDGVHCELSTDYHHLVLKNYLWIRRLALLNNIAFPAVVDEQIKKALEFALHTHKPDGMIPSLSDGDSRSFVNLLDQGYQLYGNLHFLYVARTGKEGTPPSERSKGFPNSGYYILRSGWGDGSEPYEDERYLIFDCGPLGAGNHGHFDLLSFEMAAYGQSLIVDPGRYTYDESGDVNWRVRFRETAAHNTVLVDGKNQTRYTFNKTRHKINGPHPDFELQTFVTKPGFDFLHGIARSHEYPVVHERKIFFVCPEYWIMTDRLIASELHRYDLRFHLSSQAEHNISMRCEANTLAVHSPHLIMAQPAHDAIQPCIEKGYISQTYGVKHSAPIIQFTQRAACAVFHTVLVPYKTIAPAVSVETDDVYTGKGESSNEEASVLYVTITHQGKTSHDTYFVKHTASEKEYRFGEMTCMTTGLFIRKDENGQMVRKHVF